MYPGREQTISKVYIVLEVLRYITPAEDHRPPSMSLKYVIISRSNVSP